MKIEAIRFITLQEAVEIHDHQIEKFGGIYGIRDKGLLESALLVPQSTFGQRYLHNDLFTMGVAYFYHLIKNHPFIDGNKRTGTVVTVSFLLYNGIYSTLSAEKLFELAMKIANSRITKGELTKVLKANSSTN